MALKYGTVSHLLPETYKRMVSDWLEEDCPSFDYSGFVVGGAAAEAELLGKSAVSFDLLHFFLIQYQCALGGNPFIPENTSNCTWNFKRAQSHRISFLDGTRECKTRVMLLTFLLLQGDHCRCSIFR